eukprot:g20723.t1
MKCFKRLVMAHINSSLPTCLNPLQFAYRHNRSTEDAISLALHSSLEHLDNKDTYIRFLEKGGEHAPISINRAEINRAESIKFLGLRKFGRFLTNFYRCTTESILSRYILAWFGNCSTRDHKKLQKV